MNDKKVSHEYLTSKENLEEFDSGHLSGYRRTLTVPEKEEKHFHTSKIINVSPIKKPIFEGTNSKESSPIEVINCVSISSTTDNTSVKSINEKNLLRLVI